MVLPDQKLLENIFIQSFNAIAITNTDFDNLKFEYVNPAFLALTGYKENEILGSSPKILQGKKTQKEETQRLKELCLKGETFKGHNINYKKDGSTYWVEWIVSPIKDENGEITKYLSIQKDISVEKELEEKLIQSVKLNTLYNLSSGLTHELNSSLTTIKGSTEMLKLDINELDDEKLSNRMSTEINTLDNSVSEIANIANSLHHLTNSEVKLEKQVNIFELIMDALNMYKDDLKHYTTCVINGHNAFDKKDIHYKEFYADVQKSSMRHVFIIIIDNAVDEFRSIDDKNNSILGINIKQTNDLMTIEFTDNAGGIKHKNIAKIFNAIYKDKTASGLGMGLHVAKNIMIDIGGDIEAYSNPPETTLRVTIPL